MKFSSLVSLTLFTISTVSQDVPNVLVYGSAGSQENQAAIKLGYNTTIVTDSEWANMSTVNFTRYDAVVIPDLSSDSILSLDFLEKSKAIWSPAITGSIVVIGGDPGNHASYVGARLLIEKSIRFAVTGRPQQGSTGLYLALSRMYDRIDKATVDVLSYFGNFTVRGNLACYDKAHLVATSPALDSLNDGALSNWGCSVHEAFSSYPTSGKTDFQALAIAQDVMGEGSQRFGDDSVGLPYIISHGATPAACGDRKWDQTYGEECDDGNALDGDGCSSSCKCESGLPNGDGSCGQPPKSSGYGPPPPCHTGKHGPKRKPSGYGAAPTVSS